MAIDNSIIAGIVSHSSSLSKSHRVVAKYIEENIEEVAFSTAKALSNNIGVSEATLVRFARKIGFDSYTAMQNYQRGAYIKRSSLVDTLQITKSSKQDDVMEQVVRSEIERMNRMLMPEFKSEFMKAVELINNAGKVYIVASRGSAAVADHFAFYLNYLRPNVISLSNDCGDYVDRLIDSTDKDTVVAIGILRYTKRTIDVMNVCKSRGMRIVGITDSRISPVAELSDVSLACEISSGSNFWSPAGIMCLINAMLQKIAIDNKEYVEARLSKLDKYLEQSNTYAGKSNLNLRRRFSTK